MTVVVSVKCRVTNKTDPVERSEHPVGRVLTLTKAVVARTDVAMLVEAGQSARAAQEGSDCAARRHLTHKRGRLAWC